MRNSFISIEFVFVAAAVFAVVPQISVGEDQCRASIELVSFDRGTGTSDAAVTVKIALEDTNCTNSTGSYAYDLIILNTSTGKKQTLRKSKGWSKNGASTFERTDHYYIQKDEELDAVENLEITKCVCLSGKRQRH